MIRRGATFPKEWIRSGIDSLPSFLYFLKRQAIRQRRLKHGHHVSHIESLNHLDCRFDNHIENDFMPKITIPRNIKENSSL